LPVFLCPFDVHWLGFLVAAREQDNHAIAIKPEIDSVAGACVNLEFKNAATDRPAVAD
jgi:hypothetical protein